MFEDQELKEFDHWLMFADFESHSCFQYHPTSFFVEKDATHLRQQRGQGRNLMALFRDFCFNSPAALAAGEIRVQKKRAVSDAQMASCFMCFLSTKRGMA
jgi:hypothetical protein